MILIIDFGKKSDKERLYQTLKGLKEKPYRVEIKMERNSRSNQQNKYYWGVVLKILSDFTGFSTDEMHETLKYKFLRYSKALPTGECVEVTKRTSRLDTMEFEEYLEKVRMFSAQELDVLIPLPGEYLEV